MLTRAEEARRRSCPICGQEIGDDDEVVTNSEAQVDTFDGDEPPARVIAYHQDCLIAEMPV